MNASEQSALRRELHQRPEPGWREFWTTSKIVEEIESIGVDELYYGRDVHDAEARMALPEPEDLEDWRERAAEAGARADVLEAAADGFTGAIAVLENGDGPTIGLRVDIDGLPILESDEADHVPAAEGFRSENEGYMHACGHDGHMTIGLGVLESIKDSDFSGTLKVFFQPGEEISGGGKSMAESGHLDDVDSLLAVHVGLGHPTGTVVAGIEKPLAMAHFDVTFEGESAHAGKAPNEGKNALLAASTAVQNAYSIARHQDGMTRVNFGEIHGGTASNIVAEEITLKGEVRGETNELMEYMKEEVLRVVEHAAAMHGCEVDATIVSESPRADSDPELRSVIEGVAGGMESVDTVIPTVEFGASEDATFLMEKVQEQGGLAAYSIVGTDHPTGHHTARFDVDEETLDIGIDLLTRTIRSLDD